MTGDAGGHYERQTQKVRLEAVLSPLLIVGICWRAPSIL